jgi:hypothetical protein
MNRNSHDSPELSNLERSVLDVALSGDHPSIAILRNQVMIAQVASRTPSGVGFMTKLRLPRDVILSPDRDMPAVPIVYAEHPQLPGGAEFLLQIKDGHINCIEAFCYEGMWPADDSLFRVRIG